MHTDNITRREGRKVRREYFTRRFLAFTESLHLAPSVFICVHLWLITQLAFFQMDLPRAERCRLRIVRDHDDGFASVAAQGLQGGKHLLRAVRIEIAGRLVGYDEFGIRDQRAGDGHALLLAAG